MLLRTWMTIAVLAPVAVLADEGKWTPQQVLELGDARLKAAGIELPAKRLWDPSRGTGLLAGTVYIDGCSAGFISQDGLLITNHHCLFSILQEHSTPERNLIDLGFLAKTRAEELRGKTNKARVPRRFTDVTKEILAAVPEGADDLQRAKAIERKGKELVAKCEEQPETRCSVAAFDGGLWYTLIDTHELKDLRLVYAPPRAVGDYGGEVDNWMWPRHAGDFAIARVYGADGKPYRPEFFFPLAPEGVQPGDAVMVLGYPARTYRALTAAEVQERRDVYFPARVEILGKWIDEMLAATEKSPAGRIKVEDNVKSLSNAAKNAQGQLAAFERGHLVDKAQAHEAEVLAFAKARPEFAGALKAREELEALVARERLTAQRDFLLDRLQPSGLVVSKLLYLSTTLVRAAQERAKPDLERDPAFMERELPRMKEALEREQQRFFQPSDRAVTLDFLRRALALPKDQRIAAIDRAFGKVKDAALPAVLDRLYARTKVFDVKERLKMFSETEAQLRARKDPLLELGFALAPEVTARVQHEDLLEGAISRLRPQWRKAVLAHAGKPVAPDANGTLRVTFGRVRGYSPKDAVMYLPQTTLSGLLAKNQDAPPFNVPQKVKDAAAQKKFGRWKDAKLGDVPVDFLADADTTGGNSGSPTVNGRGQLVGVNFDRVWENVANDFGYNPDIARNVNADVRYLLWQLDQVENADALLRELGAAR